MIYMGVFTSFIRLPNYLPSVLILHNSFISIHIHRICGGVALPLHPSFCGGFVSIH